MAIAVASIAATVVPPSESLLIARGQWMRRRDGIMRGGGLPRLLALFAQDLSFQGPPSQHPPAPRLPSHPPSPRLPSWLFGTLEWGLGFHSSSLCALIHFLCQLIKMGDEIEVPFCTQLFLSSDHVSQFSFYAESGCRCRRVCAANIRQIYLGL